MGRDRVDQTTADQTTAGWPGFLDGLSVVLCTGSGGVGKTTTAAVIARAAALAGQRAVVVTIDPARRLAEVLGIDTAAAAGGIEPQRVPLDAPGEMWAMMLDASAMFDAVVREEATDEYQAERILTNSFYRSIAGSLGGTQEYMATEMLHGLVRDGRWDLVVVDTPPTRASLRFLAAPDVLDRFVQHRAFRTMMLAEGVGGRLITTASQPLLRLIGTVVGGDAVRDAVAFFRSFAGLESGFRRRAQEVAAILRDEATGFVVVTTPAADAVAEAIWFCGELRARGHGVRAVIVNRAHRFPLAGQAEVPADWPAEAHRVREWSALMMTAEAVEIARLAVLPGVREVRRVPLMAGQVESPAGLDLLASHLFAD